MLGVRKNVSRDRILLLSHTHILSDPLERLRFPDFFYKLGSEDREWPRPEFEKSENLWKSTVFLLCHLASFDTFWLPIWTWLGVSNASSTKRYGAVQIRQKSTAVANMKPVSDFCRTCWLMLSHGSGRIDEEVENLYSAWELLSAEAGRLFPCSVSIFKIFWRPKLVRVRYCLNCVK